MLIGRSNKGTYKCKIDSLLKEAYSIEHVKEWGKYRQELKAPCNSEDSEEDKPIVGSEDSDENEVKLQFEEDDEE